MFPLEEHKSKLTEKRLCFIEELSRLEMIKCFDARSINTLKVETKSY